MSRSSNLDALPKFKCITTISAKQKDFIVLAAGDKNAYGYDEHTLPFLVELIDLSKPDARQFTHIGVVAYYLYSSRSIAVVEEVISKLETLQKTDQRFGSLGIGLARGPAIADFGWFGRINKKFIPLGEIINTASKGIADNQTYRTILKSLRHRQ